MKQKDKETLAEEVLEEWAKFSWESDDSKKTDVIYYLAEWLTGEQLQILKEIVPLTA